MEPIRLKIQIWINKYFVTFDTTYELFRLYFFIIFNLCTVILFLVSQIQRALQLGEEIPENIRACTNKDVGTVIGKI